MGYDDVHGRMYSINNWDSLKMCLRLFFIFFASRNARESFVKMTKYQWWKKIFFFSDEVIYAQSARVLWRNRILVECKNSLIQWIVWLKRVAY